MDEGDLWSFFRRVLEQGRAIAMDDAAGKYPSYEHLSARLDEAARERVKMFREECADLPDDFGEIAWEACPHGENHKMHCSVCTPDTGERQ